MNYETYIFDLDGTLLDTLSDLAASTNYALACMDMPQRTVDEVRSFVGNGVRVLMQRAVPGGISNPRFEQTFQIFRQHYLKHQLDNTMPYPGVVGMLERLQQEKKQIAVVSNKFMAATQQLCKHFFGPLVQLAIGETETIRRKPAPDSVLAVMRELQAKRGSTVYIGDSDVDILTARAAQVPCISVLWGFRDKSFLLRCGATTFAERPEDIA